MKKYTVTIAGATGIVGRHIISHAKTQGWHVRVLTRSPKKNNDSIEYFPWDPENPSLLESTVAALEGSDFLINLAGRSLASGLSPSIQRSFLQTRLASTRTLTDAYSRCKNPPSVWGQASALAFYGDTGEQIITESATRGNLFLSNVAGQWENTAEAVKTLNPEVKLIIARFALVLARDALAWRKMLLPVKMGLGGAIGSGSQWYSWIDADDVARAFFHLFHKDGSGGIYNFSSPGAVRQKDLACKMARFLHRPCFMKVPAFALRVLMGKTADEFLLPSCRALPEKLLASGFKFTNPDVDSEITRLLG